MDWTLFSLATNDDVAKGINLSETFEKYCGIVEEASGSSKKVAWWLEYTVNHDPGHWWVSDQLSLLSLWFPRMVCAD
jgi:hypothetical protein